MPFACTNSRSAWKFDASNNRPVARPGIYLNPNVLRYPRVLSYHWLMIIVKGNKTEELSRGKLEELLNNYERVVLDLGTGDGRFVYEHALREHPTFFIGVDPSQKQLEVYSKKAVRKKMENLIYVVGSIEVLPQELFKIADLLYIVFPWGTLLKSTVDPDEKTFYILSNILKPQGTLEIIFGYTSEAEPSETVRLELPEISEELISGSVVPKFENAGFKMEKLERLEKLQLKDIRR